MGYQAELLGAVERVNDRQKHVLFDKIHKHFNGQLKGKTFALWGLSFKPKTDDMREAPSRVLLEALIAAGATVRAYDPEALAEAKRIYGDKVGLILCKSQTEALNNADALCVVTEWKNFWSPDFAQLKQKLKESVVFDGRNLYELKQLKAAGLTYYCIGRPVNN